MFKPYDQSPRITHNRYILRFYYQSACSLVISYNNIGRFCFQLTAYQHKALAFHFLPQLNNRISRLKINFIFCFVILVIFFIKHIIETQIVFIRCLQNNICSSFVRTSKCHIRFVPYKVLRIFPLKTYRIFKTNSFRSIDERSNITGLPIDG